MEVLPGDAPPPSGASGDAAAADGRSSFSQAGQPVPEAAEMDTLRLEPRLPANPDALAQAISRAWPARTAYGLLPRGWGWPQAVAAAIARRVVSSQCDRLLEQAERLDSKSWFGFNFWGCY